VASNSLEGIYCHCVFIAGTQYNAQSEYYDIPFFPSLIPSIYSL